MNTKIIKKRKGSSLVLILIVMSVLMILGTSMLTLAVNSYKFRALEQNRKTNLYSSEAGLDEAYEKIGKFVDEAIKQGNKAVEEYDKNFENLIKVERYRLEHGDKKESAYIDENGLITASTVDEDRKRVFQYGYIVSSKVSVKISYKEDDIRRDIECYDKDAISSDDGYKIELGYTQFIRDYINNECISKIKDTTDSKLLIEAKVLEDNKTSYPINISVNSKYTKNSIPREIEAIYEIKMAELNVKYSLPTEIVKIPKNPVWSKALMVGGNMKINNGKVNIKDGNIYVKGKDGNREASGIDLTNKDSKLYSNKDIVTNRNLVLSYNQDNKDSIDNNIYIGGNVFCRNLLINETAKGAKLKIIKSLYTLDDLEINAPNSHIDIEDSYYGVSDGSDGERNNPDNSSSIIINTEDIGNRTGDEGKTITHNEDKDSVLNIGKNVYIAGTSYINLLSQKYQTGESISIVGNYRAYTESLPFTNDYLKNNNNANVQFKEDNVIFDYLDPLTLVTKYKEGIVDLSDIAEAVIEQDRYITVYLTTKGANNPLYNSPKTYYSIVYDNKESKKALIGNTVKIDSEKKTGDKVSIKFYKDDKSLIIDDSYEDKPYEVELIKHVQLNAFDKSKYFEEYNKQIPSKNGLNLGEGIHINKDINPSTENIHAGSIFASQNDTNAISSGNWSIPLDMKIKARSIQLKNQLFYMGAAKSYVDLISTTNIDAINDSTGIADSKYYEIDDEIEPMVTINNNVNFHKLSPKNEVSSDEIAILGKDDSKTYVLIEDGLDDTKYEGMGNTEIKKVSATQQYKGIIIVEGNVTIVGNLNFSGTIICNGNLTFEGVGDKNITYNKAYIENFAINNYEIFKMAFNDVGKYAQDDESNYLFAKVYKNINSSTSSESNNQLIKRTKWKLIK